MYIISGMHRSGTSLVARLLYEAGADMGDSATFYRGDKWNPDGYYEQPEVHRINMRLINGWWGKLAYFKLPGTETIMRRAGRIRGDIGRMAAKYKDKVVKETRFCLTLPAWLAHGARVDRMLICLRDPVAVAASLKRRNWITTNLAYQLWLEHNNRLLAERPAEIPIWFVNYANLLNEQTFSQEISLAIRFLGMDLSDGRLVQLQQSIVKPSPDQTEPADVDYPEEVQRLWERLKEAHKLQFNFGTEQAVTDLAT